MTRGKFMVMIMPSDRLVVKITLAKHVLFVHLPEPGQFTPHHLQ